MRGVWCRKLRRERQLRRASLYTRLLSDENSSTRGNIAARDGGAHLKTTHKVRVQPRKMRRRCTMAVDTVGEHTSNESATEDEDSKGNLADDGRTGDVCAPVDRMLLRAAARVDAA
eukprot:scaffold259642_cov33-Tisochrysis_lutea.AAC.3